jgi:hypothetical protein
MKPCPDCERLARAPLRAGLPSNLLRVATVDPTGAVALRYECRHCETEWTCTPEQGWHSALTSGEPVPLLARVAQAARSTLDRLRP